MRKSEQELLNKYKNSLSNAGMGLWELDLAVRTVKWDEGFRRLYELEDEIYEGQADEMLHWIHPEDRESLSGYVKARLESDTDASLLFRIITSKGRAKYIRTCVYKIPRPGKEALLVGLNWDVTNESLLQLELSRAKNFTENILNAIPDPIFVKNEQHQWIYANIEFEKLLGKKKSEFIGKNDLAFFAKEHVDVYWAKDREVLQNSQPNENEEKIVDAIGRTRDILTKKTPLQITPGERVLVGVIRDITDLKHIQNSLIEQSKMASLGEMAAGIAHEVNNPLTIIQGKAQLLQEKLAHGPVDTTAFRKDLELIVQNCVRIDKIIKSLKSVSRKADLDPFEDVGILELIDEAFEISKDRFRKKRLNLFVITDEFIDYSYKTKARPSEIVQVLVNLLNNSYDAVHDQPNGWARINLSLIKNKYQIEVTDSGAEIEPEVIQKMMEPFFTTKSTGKGTGLGLSVSRQIIQNHKGEFFFDSRNPNTCFVFTLPKA